MARPREYNRDVVVSAAKEEFWRNGYEASDLHALEEATQLSRSSVYLAFGSKRGLFSAAMADYQSTFTDAVLGPVESDRATPADAAGFFSTVASLFGGELGNRGCLIVNAIGELAGRDADMAERGAELHERYRLAFVNALGSGGGGNVSDADAVGEHARVLAVAAMGIWVTSRVDPDAAAEACDAMIELIARWTHGKPRRRPRTG